jgi:hypothetical protein
MNKTFLLFPLRFENIIYIISSYSMALTLIILFKNTSVSKFILEILKFSYPMTSIVVALMLAYIIYKEDKIFKNVLIPFLPLAFSWAIIYFLIFIFL